MPKSKHRRKGQAASPRPPDRGATAATRRRRPPGSPRPVSACSSPAIAVILLGYLVPQRRDRQLADLRAQLGPGERVRAAHRRVPRAGPLEVGPVRPPPATAAPPHARPPTMSRRTHARAWRFHRPPPSVHRPPAVRSTGRERSSTVAVHSAVDGPDVRPPTRQEQPVPVYEYACASCDARTERLLPHDRAGDPGPCPACQGDARAPLQPGRGEARGLGFLRDRRDGPRPTRSRRLQAGPGTRRAPQQRRVLTGVRRGRVSSGAAARCARASVGRSATAAVTSRARAAAPRSRTPRTRTGCARSGRPAAGSRTSSSSGAPMRAPWASPRRLPTMKR